MDSKLLRSFLHVVDQGNMSRAAEIMNMTQPALSRQIKMLEQEAGAHLFVRTGRGVRLTETGQLVEVHARRIVQETDRLSMELANLQGALTGDLCVGFPPSVGLRFAGPLIERFRAEYPGVRLRIVHLLSGTLEQKLLKGRVDIGVLFAGNLSKVLNTETLWQEPLVLVASTDSDLATGKRGLSGQDMTLGSLFGLPLILPRAGHGLRDLLERAAFREGQSLDVVLEVDSLLIQMELVRRNLGYTLLPADLCRDDVEAGRLVRIPIDNPVLIRTAVLAWSAEFPLTAAGRAMSAMIQATLSH